MAFQGDGDGNIQFPNFSTGVGDFTIDGGNITYPSGGAFEVILGPASGSSGYIYADSGGTLKFNTSNGTVTLSGFNSGDVVPISISRSVNTVTFTAGSQSGTVGFGGAALNFARFFSLRDVTTLRFSGKIGGVWRFANGVDADRLYNFNQLPGTANLPDDGTDAANGTLVGFTSGDFDGSGLDSITLDTPTDNKFLNRDNVANNSRNVVISGEINGTQPTSVEARLDNGNWQTVDSSPTATTWSGSITITGTQFLQVRGVGADTISQTITVIVGAAIVAIGDSNQQGYGINTQPVTLPAISTVPLMYNGTEVVNLQDPTSTVGIGGGNGGSTLPRVASRYARDGVAVCIYNIGRGGTEASEWTKPSSNYDKIAAFHTLTGGIELVTCQLGTNDASSGVSGAAFTASMNSIVNDIAADFSCNTLLTKFATKTPSLPNRTAILTAIDNIVSTNANAKEGGDFTGMDISTGAATGNDGVHFKQDDDLTQAGDIIYEANIRNFLDGTQISLTATGIPDGNYRTVLYDENWSKQIHDQIIAWSNNTSTATVIEALNTNVLGAVYADEVIDVDGCMIKGVVS